MSSVNSGGVMGKILVVGSLAYDSIQTPAGKAIRTLGGSANYFSLGASLFSQVNVVGVVGDDYSENDMALLKERRVNVDGIQRVHGKTFHWEGAYGADMNEALTIATHLNVFEHFRPRIPESYKNCDYVFLANIDPVLQTEVLSQLKSPRVVASDTMNFWITSKLPELRKIISKVDLLLVNEGEAKLLTGTSNAIAAAHRIVEMGPQATVIKRGEYGFVLYAEKKFFILPAFPIANVVDPTGAGDTFASGVMSYLAKHKLTVTHDALKKACVYGGLLASFTVQDFGVGRLKSLTLDEVESRHKDFEQVITL